MKAIEQTVFFAVYHLLSSVLVTVSQTLNKMMLSKRIRRSIDPKEVRQPEHMILGINQFGHLMRMSQ